MSKHIHTSEYECGLICPLNTAFEQEDFNKNIEKENILGVPDTKAYETFSGREGMDRVIIIM